MSWEALEGPPEASWEDPREVPEALGAPGGSLGVKMASWTVLGGSRRIFGGVPEATFSLFGEVNLHTV